ncbi:hypothetical protein B0I35DRAFT_445208 [Stachybotrys elegans]|uniref:Secreted protein n=1 Tax=Stachybotrys elegans TaxID=80388 RepID=A0A8K0WLE2_9HYPO|nr:hypothetical protein B0I35DRAFT_445208 [Stachybotrys elegans]
MAVISTMLQLVGSCYVNVIVASGVQSEKALVKRVPVSGTATISAAPQENLLHGPPSTSKSCWLLTMKPPCLSCYSTNYATFLRIISTYPLIAQRYRPNLVLFSRKNGRCFPNTAGEVLSTHVPNPNRSRCSETECHDSKAVRRLGSPQLPPGTYHSFRDNYDHHIHVAHFYLWVATATVRGSRAVDI